MYPLSAASTCPKTKTANQGSTSVFIPTLNKMMFALVTGASGGIGLCLAEELAKRKINLLLIARSEDKLTAAATHLKSKYGIEAFILAIDLSQPLAENKVKAWVDAHQWPVNILINNAGYGLWGRAEDLDISTLNNMMQLNMNSMVNLSHSMIPILRKQTQSYILNVASTAAYQAVPTLTVYAATKAFVVLYSRGLRWELKGTGISVSCLSPGATSTGFIDRAGMQSMKERADKFSMKAEVVAAIGIDGMFKRKAEIIPGFVNWISVMATYLLPKTLVERIAYGLYKV